MSASRLILVAMLALTATAANAAEIVSQYTSIDPAKCRKVDGLTIEGSDVYSIHACPGIGGYLAVVSEDDARYTVTIGRTVKAAEKEPAAREGFLSFNTARDTIEWRGQKGKPYAIIQRWSIADQENTDKDGRPASMQFLVVTRLPPGPVCQVAFVDAKANGVEGNALARQAADEIASRFKCGKDDVKIVGKEGRATALAVRTPKASSEAEPASR